MDLNFFIHMLRNIISTFFQNGIWVVGFFYLLFKTYENAALKKISKYLISAVLIILFIYSIKVSN